ncbi:MAG TPA: hypothetical protein VK474_00625, partial [Chthoniobacterales bacterium]|nr:hypothetical protein [Chthoniobacterales bacterium]
TLFALAPAHLAFQQPAMLQRLTNESDAMPLIKTFTKDYLPQNYGAAEDIPKRFVLYSGWGRFIAGWSFLGLGWYIFGLGAFFVGLHALANLRGQRAFVLVALFGLPLAALAIVLAPAMIGQHYFTNGAIAKAHGQNRAAIAAFRRAMRWDSWHSQDIDLYATIGELERAAGMPEGSPEQHINRAMTFEKESQWEQAIFELEVAGKSGGALGATARQEAARAHVFFGLALYHAGGIGSAVTHWQQALMEDPGQIYAMPYLARGYFDIGSYDSAVETVKELVKIVRDHNSLLGDAYSLGGDAYARMGRIVEARAYYNLSLTSDPVQNYWALTGLVGE